MKQQILKPENWQYFEELCKVLWGEIWNCPEIKKNGRAGQNQHGIDIYGIPENQSQYFGIQCKGKDDYTKATLTEKEINLEIEKAKKFTPPLKKMYFATTANKDAKIEEFVRIKDIENRSNNLFEVHLFCWEDIAYLIEQNKRANDYYIKKKNFITNYRVEVLLDNGTNIKSFAPILVKHHIKYKIIDRLTTIQKLGSFKVEACPTDKELLQINTDAQPVRYYLHNAIQSIAHYNHSSCVFSVKIKNIGNSQLENFKLYLSFDEEYYITEIVSKRNSCGDFNKYDYNINWVKGSNCIEFKTPNEILVPADEVFLDKICLRPKIAEPFCIIIPWKLVSKDFSESGLLHIELNTETKTEKITLNSSVEFPDEIVLDNYIQIV